MTREFVATFGPWAVITATLIGLVVAAARAAWRDVRDDLHDDQPPCPVYPIEMARRRRSHDFGDAA